jgi:hypothetical protein
MIVSERFLRDPVMWTAHIAQPVAGLKIDRQLEGNRQGRSRRRWSVQRRDLKQSRPLGCISRRDDHRKAQAVLAVLETRDLLILELDDRVLVRHQAGDGGGEDVRTMLLNEGCLSPFTSGLLVRTNRLGALVDLADDHTRSDRHPQCID